jgi:hypothetical protein
VIEWKITLTNNIPEVLANEKGFQDAMKIAMHAAGRLWLTTFLPMHFESGAAGRYGYKPRTMAFDKRKQNVTRQRPIPMVFFDALYPTYGRTLKTTLVKDGITGKTPVNKLAEGGVFSLRIPVDLPHAMNASISSSTLGQGRGEIVRLNKVECNQMAKLINKKMTERLKIAPVAEVTRIQV